MGYATTAGYIQRRALWLGWHCGDHPVGNHSNRVVENLEPNAYALYIACFTEVMGYDLEAEFDCPIKPLNIRRTPLAEFLGVDEGVFEGATLTASRLDCEAGYIDIEIDEEETGER